MAIEIAESSYHATYSLGTNRFAMKGITMRITLGYKPLRVLRLLLIDKPCRRARSFDTFLAKYYHGIYTTVGVFKTTRQHLGHQR